MRKVVIGKNEENQRLDKFLKKYLVNAPLSYIYKAVRKDIKVNGKRCKIDYMLLLDDEVSIFISDDEFDKLTHKRSRYKVKKQFTIAYEDENILVAEKPFGLLTHGDNNEKKNHLANQVVDYLIEKGDYNPRIEKTFTPAPVNRLDRNTTGLVLFGKTNRSLQLLNSMIRDRDKISKYYLTIVKGKMKKELHLQDKMTKDREKNMVSVLPTDDEGKYIETIARPVSISQKGFTLVEVEIITGRTHQIRAHLAKAGYPIIGDAKYGDKRTNATISQSLGLNTQLLHAYKLKFDNCQEDLQYLKGKEIVAQLPEDFDRIKHIIFDHN